MYIQSFALLFLIGMFFVGCSQIRYSRFDDYLQKAQEFKRTMISPAALSKIERFRNCSSAQKKAAAKEALSSIGIEEGPNDLTARSYKISEAAWIKMFGPPDHTYNAQRLKYSLYDTASKTASMNPEYGIYVKSYRGYIVEVESNI